jgi:hypothetical protein
MKKIFFLLLITNSILQFINSQTSWQRCIGGTNHEQANCIIQTTDGGYAIAGYTFSYAAGYEDMYIIKCNSSGTIQWTKTIGGSNVEIARSIIQTTDGGYAIAGDIYDYGSTTADWFIVKTDAGGAIQWTRTINRAAYDYACSIVQTTDGGYAIAGMSATGGVFSGDIYVVKLNSAGTYQWSKTYGGTHDEVAYTIIKTTDGGLAFAGYSNSFGPYNVFNFIKTDDLGNIQWNRLVGESGTGSHVYSIIQLADGSYVLAGEITPTGTGNYDMYIVKLNSSGSIIWTRTVAGTGYDMANSIIQTTDGGFVLGGYTNSYGAGANDMYIVKLNSSGTLQWSKTVGGTGDEQALGIIKSIDGGFTAAGYTSSFGNGGKDVFLVKFDDAGNTCGNTTTPSGSSGTSGTATSPTFTVVTQNPTVTTPSPILGTGGILTTICSTLPPLPPTLVSPPNGSYNQPSTVRFIWNKSISALTYRLQVSQDSLFTNLVVNDSTLTDSTIVVTNLTVNKYYWWRVNAKNTIGTSPYSIVWKFGTFLVGLNQISSEIPYEFKLFNNYPNPFNPFTIIRFDLPAVGKVNFSVFDILGKEIYTLKENLRTPGTFEVQIDGTNYPSGIYVYRLISGNFSETKKMVLIK